MNTTFDSRPGPPGSSPRRGHPGRGDDLLDDLGGGQVAGEAALAGGAERAGHAAAGLAGHADRDPVGVAHQHALDQRAVVQAPQRLAGRPGIGLQRADLGEQRGQQGRPDLRAHGRRQVGHRRRIVLEPAEVVPAQLVGAKRRQAEFDDGGPAGGRVEIGEMGRRLGAAGRLEDERERGHDASILPDSRATRQPSSRPLARARRSRLAGGFDLGHLGVGHREADQPGRVDAVVGDASPSPPGRCRRSRRSGCGASRCSAPARWATVPWQNTPNPSRGVNDALIAGRARSWRAFGESAAVVKYQWPCRKWPSTAETRGSPDLVVGGDVEHRRDRQLGDQPLGGQPPLRRHDRLQMLGRALEARVEQVLQALQLVGRLVHAPRLSPPVRHR